MWCDSVYLLIFGQKLKYSQIVALNQNTNF
jgi:hypothetical protein